MTPSQSKIGPLKRGCVILLACAVAFALVPVGFFCYMFWSIGHQMKAERRELFAAINNPTALNLLQQTAQPFFGHSGLSEQETQSLFREFHWLPHYESPNPIYDNQHHITAIVIWCGGADNHFGLVVNATTTTPNNQSAVKRQLAPRVWFWDELNNMPTP